MDDLRFFISQFIQIQTGLDAHLIEKDLPFEHFGLTSSQLVVLIRDLEKKLGKTLRVTLGWEYPTINSLASFLLSQAELLPNSQTFVIQDEMAIVGMSCRYPKAENLEGFWKVCVEGVDAISEVPIERWDMANFYDPDPLAKGKIYSKWGGFLEKIDQFDASFFGISPREAIHIDPRQRLALEVSWEALCDAGIEPSSLKGSNAGVFIATLSDDYGKLVFSNPDLVEAYSGSGTAHSMVANRLSYFYDLSGPSLAVDTACSGSLVALHLAAQSLKSNETNIAIVGGVNLLLSPDSTIFFSRAQALSKVGRCQTFDALADGFVRSEGVGIVVLKRLSDALLANDRIYSVIKGSAVNQDGRTNGTMAPNPKAQEAVLRQAYKQAKISPGQVQYVELHGTGTKIGDPIEAEALASVLKEGRSANDKCFVGSVKTNIGHTEAASGIAGVIKTSLAIFHKKIPKNLHFKEPNPFIPMESYPFTVITSSQPWPSESVELIAGVSSFGFGGTNAHVVLGSAPKSAKTEIVSLPMPIWNKKHFWVNSNKNKASSLLDNYINPVKVPFLHLWTVNIPKYSLFNEHQIANEAVFPGAGYLEIVLEAVSQRNLPFPVQVQNVRFLKKLMFLQESGIQFSITEESKETRFEIHSSKANYACGVISYDLLELPHRDVEIIFSKVKSHLSAKEHYQKMLEQGLGYGPSFQAIKEIHLGNSFVIAKIDRPATHEWTICIDALFQLTAVLKSDKGKEKLHLPVEVEKIDFYESLNSPWILGYVYDEDLKGTLHTHLELLDPNTGKILVKVTSLHLIEISKKSASYDFTSQISKQKFQLESHLFFSERFQSKKLYEKETVYSLSWEKIINLNKIPFSAGQTRWLIIGPKEKVSGEIISLLKMQKADVIQVEDFLNLESCHLDFSAQKWNIIAFINEQFTQIVKLTQICLASPIFHTLCFVTRGAQSIKGEFLTIPSCEMSLAWGFGRAAMHIEHPSLHGKLIDLDPSAEDPLYEAKQILNMWTHSEDQIACRQGVYYLPRLRSVSFSSSYELSFDRDSSYLIVGGLGALGLSVADWMYTQGARQIILTGLHLMPDRNLWEDISDQHPRYQAIKAILRLESLGCQIETYSTDSSQLPSLENLLQERKRGNLPPIRGIMYAAGFINDASITTITEEHIESVLSSKTKGAKNLYLVFKNEPLDFIIFFSSFASILPLIGQSIYAAANAFLDSFIHFLRGQNIPAFSMNWGPVQIGMASLLEDQDLHIKRGVIPVNPALCWEALGQALQNDYSSLAVACVDWSQVYQSRAYCPPMIRELIPIEILSENTQSAAVSVLELLKQSASSVLQIELGDIDSQRSLTHMGLDSLMATELKNLLGAKHGLKVTISDLLKEMTLIQLSDTLLLNNPDIGGGSPGNETLKNGVDIQGNKYLSLTSQSGDSSLLLKSKYEPFFGLENEIQETELDQKKYPLSYPQEGIWFLEKSGHQFVFNIAGVSIHFGRFDPFAFYRAVDEVFASQDILRTGFFEENGLPYAKVLPFVPIPQTIVDLSHLDEDEKQRSVHNLFEKEARNPFDLEKGHLLRIVCVKLQENEHRILVVLHHLIADGVSTRIFMKNIFSLLDRNPILKPSKPYVEFALKQRQNHYSKELLFWEQRLSPIPPRLELPKRNIPKSSLKGKRLKFDIPKSLVDRVQQLAREEKMTPFTILFSVYSILLERYSNQDRFAIGVVMAGRESHEVEDLIGCFINTLPLVVDFSKVETFREYLNRLKEELLMVYDHSEVPFEQILRHIHAPRDSQVSPIFQAAFSFEKDPTDDFKEVPFFFEEIHLGISRYELSLEIVVGKRGMSAWFDYQSELYDSSLIDQMAKHFVILLENATKHLDSKIYELDILSANEREMILTGFNQSTTPYPRDFSIYELFIRQAFNNPEAIALEDGKRRLSYQKLSDYVNQLADKFRRLGIKKNDSIGLYADRSIELVIAILSLLKCGACYVPIDPLLPRNRIREMVQLASISFIVTKGVSAELVQIIGLPFYELEDLEKFVEECDLDETNNKQNPTDLACILYSSGSTGQPKGIMISHRNIIRLVCNTNYAQFGPEEAFLLFAPVNFDAALFEIWGALLNGGRLFVAPSRPLGFDELGLIIQDHQISTLWMTAALFQSMSEEDMLAFGSLRQFLVGGDVVPEKQAAQFLRLNPTCSLINGYGPTEGTTFSCCHRIVLSDIGNDSIPIGKPVSNTQVYLLDRHLRPVPIGVLGEICIGGDGVSLGYVKNSELTSKRFCFSAFSPSQIYKTGDFGFFLPDGTIRFKGRFDLQVKLRGFRIELEEVEIHLRAHPNVKEVVAVIHKNFNGGDQLCAYITSEEPLEAKVYKEFLESRLPSYMIPSFIIMLSKMPLTPRGKIDRKLLPIPESSAILEIERAEETSNEKNLKEIWQQLLGVNTIERSSNFFELGGDSIRAIQMVSLAKRKGVHLSVQDVFMEQTLEKIASKNSSMVIPTSTAVNTNRIPLTPIQNWFFQQSIPNRSHWNHWVLFTLPGPLDASSLEKLAQSHDCFFLKFRKSGDVWEQFTTKENLFHISYLSLQGMKKDAKKRLFSQVINQEHLQLDLEFGPLFRFTFIEGFEENCKHLLIVAHHLVMDQVSWSVLLNEIEILCETKNDLSKAIVSHSYAEWALHLQELKKSTELQNEARFWDTIPWHKVKPIPFDYPNGSNLEKDAVTIESICDLSSVNLLNFDHFLTTVLIQTFHDWNQNEPICIAREQQGRPMLFNASHTIGWFTQIYPIYVEAGIPPEILQENLRQFANHALSFGLIFQEKSIGKPQILFNFLGVMDEQARGATQFGMDLNPPIQNRDPFAERTHPFEINAFISNNKLHVFWTFSPNLHRHETVANLSGVFQSFLHRALHKKSFSSGDFPLASLQRKEIDQLQEKCQNIEDIFVLSPLQEGLLLYSLLHPTSDKYLVQCILKIKEVQDLELLEKSFNLVLERHPALRASYHYDHLHHPVQVIQPLENIPWIFVKDFENHLREDRKKNFDFSKAPLMRVSVCKETDGIQILWSYHHILMDGWSMSVVLNDWFTIYEDLLSNQRVLLPPAPSYKNFVKALVPPASATQWHSFLSGFQNPTPLPVLPHQQNEENHFQDFVLSSETQLALTKTLSRERITLATFMQGIWALVLGHFSGERDIVFGITVSGRGLPVPDLELIVGLCINTVAQRILIERSQSFSSWFKSIQEAQIRMQPYHHIPLSIVQGKRSLFESLVVVENYPIQQKNKKSLSVVSVETRERVEYPLTLMVFPKELLHLRLLFDETKYCKESSLNILGVLDILISKVLSNWESHVGILLPLSKLELEEGLQEIWKEILGLSHISSHDSYQDLGGNSLSLIRMKGCLQQRFNIDIPLVDLFKHQTIESWVNAIFDTDQQPKEVKTRAEVRKRVRK